MGDFATFMICGAFWRVGGLFLEAFVSLGSF